jgi:serine/threonine protein kinase
VKISQDVRQNWKMFFSFFLFFQRIIVPIRRVLGRGSSGDVVMVEDPTTKTFYAVKSMLADTEANSSAILKEMAWLFNKDVLSPFLLRYYIHFFEKGKTQVFMECCEKGDLENWVKSLQGEVSEIVYLFFFF